MLAAYISRTLNSLFPSAGISTEAVRLYSPAAFFGAGFVWDAATLPRIDRLQENLILLTYIAALGVLITVMNLDRAGRLANRPLLKCKPYLPGACQFLLGTLLSAYVLFYLQSASMTRTSVFVILLAVLLLAVKFLGLNFSDLRLQVTLFFIVLFSFLVFFIPVVLKYLNVWVFLAAALLSAGLTGGGAYLLWHYSVISSRQELHRTFVLVGCLFLVLTGFYVADWIPPVPLAVRDAGIFHSVKYKQGTYEVQYEEEAWHELFKNSDRTFHYVPGDKIYCFASVFVPSGMEVDVFHRWQYYSEQTGEWTATDGRGIPYRARGGSPDGFRGFTYKQNISDAREWRVDVEAPGGRLLKRVYFDVERVNQREQKLTTAYR